MTGIHHYIKNDKFAEYLQIEILEAAGGIATGRMDIQPHHLNSHGTVHGGVIFSLADVVLGAASNSHGIKTVAINSSISFLKAVKTGVLHARAEEMMQNPTLAVYDVKVTAGSGELVASLQCMVYRKKPPQGVAVSNSPVNVLFKYHPDLLKKFPTTVGGVIIAQNLQNGETPPELASLYREEQKNVFDKLKDVPLSQLPSLAAWRGVFSGFGVEPTKYRSAAEALLRRLTKKGDIPGINLLVDLGNLVSIRYALPVAVFEVRDINGAVTVKLAGGSEQFTPLGESVIEHPEPGEVIFADESDIVLARRWCWRQSQQSAARSDTTSAIITVEAHHPGARQDIEKALADLTELLAKFTKGTFTSAILDASNYSFVKI